MPRPGGGPWHGLIFRGTAMYRHLLVPVDATDLSSVTIDRAVEFALVLGARITFSTSYPIRHPPSCL
jgi:nucleotide-binding universal stress UspA family protein